MRGQRQPTEAKGRGVAPDMPYPACDRPNDGVPTCGAGPVRRIRWAAGDLADIARGWRDADRILRNRPPRRPAKPAVTFDPGSNSRDEVILWQSMAITT